MILDINMLNYFDFIVIIDLYGFWIILDLY